MASRFWVGGTGTWNSSNTANWSASSGGPGGASVPTSADTVTFDSNSGGSFTVTVSSPPSVASVTNANAGTLMTITLASSLTVTGSFTFQGGTLNLGTNSLNVGSFISNNTATRSITWGSDSAINCSIVSSAGVWQTPLYLNCASLTFTGTSNFNINGNSTAGNRSITVFNTNAAAIPNVTVSAGSDTIQISNAFVSTDGTSFPMAAAYLNNVTFTSGYTGTTVYFAPYASAGTMTVFGNFTMPQTNVALTLSYTSLTIFAPTSGTSNINIASPANFLTNNNGIQLSPAAGATVNLNLSSTTAGTSSFVANGSGTVNITALKTSSSFTHTSGTVNIANSSSLSCDNYQSTGTVARTLGFGTSSSINITSTSTATVFALNGTNLSVTGNSLFNLSGAAGSGITRTINLVASTFTESNAVNINVSNGAGTATFSTLAVLKSLDTTGFTGQLSATSGMTLYGGLTFTSSMTTNLAGLTFAATSSNYNITTASKVANNYTFSGLGGTWTLQDNVTISGNSCLVVSAGTLNLNNKTITCNMSGLSATGLSSTSGSVRGINFGSTGSIVINANGYTAVSTSPTNLTVQGDPKVYINFGSTSGTQSVSISTGTPLENNSFSFYLATPTGGTNNSNTFSMTNTFAVKSLDMSGCTGATISLPSSNFAVYGSIVLPTTSGTNVLFQTTTSPIIFASTQAGNTVRTNGRAFSFRPIVFNGTGGDWTLLDALNYGTTSLSVLAGTFNTGNFSVTGSNVIATGSSTRVLNLGSSTFTLSGTGATVFWDATATGLTVNPGTSSIISTGTVATINGGNANYNDLTFSSSTTSVTIGGSNTFNNVSIPSGSNTSITVSGSNTFANLTLARPTTPKYVPVVFGGNQTITGTLATSGTLVGNFRYFFQSSIADTQRTITAAALSNFGDIDFKDIVGSGVAAPFNGTRLGDAGNNSGIVFPASKNVWFAHTSTPYNWSSNQWSLSTNPAGASSDNFPLPQDNFAGITSGGWSAANSIIVDYNYIITDFTYPVISGNGLTVSSTSFTIMGNAAISGTNSTVTGNNIIMWNRTNSTKTLSYAISTGWSAPIVVDTNGTVQLASALTSSAGLTIQNGTFSTQNNTLSVLYIDSSYTSTRAINLGSSTVNISYSNDTTRGFVVFSSGLTFNAGTSTINFSGASFGIKTDSDITFNNVVFTNTSIGSVDIAKNNYNDTTTGAASITFNNLTIPARTSGASSNIGFMGISTLTVSSTLSIGTPTDPTGRNFLFSRDRIMTINSNAITSLSDIDFSGITVSGSTSPWSGTRLGNAGRNTNITFGAPKTVYWAGGNLQWGGTGVSSPWATTSGGTRSVNNFPLPQDSIIVDENSGGAGISVNQQTNYAIGSIDFSARTTSIVLNTNTGNVYSTGNVILSNAVTVSGTGIWWFVGDGTQTLNSAGKTFTQNIYIACAGTVSLAANMTSSAPSTSGGFGLRLWAGTINLNSLNWTTPVFNIIEYQQNKTIAFGTGSIIVNGTNSTIINITTAGGTNLSTTGTTAITVNGNSAGTRVINTPGMNSQANAMSIGVTAGSDTVSFTSGSGVRNLSMQGFAGTWVHAGPINLYGNLTVGTTVVTIQDVSATYVGTGTGTITSNGKTLFGQLVVNTPTGTLTLADALVLTQFTGGNASFLQLQQGTFDSNSKSITIDRFVGSGSNTRTLNMGSSTWNLTAIDDAVNGRLTWDISSSALPPGLTLNPSSSTIALNGNGTKTFNGGSQTYNNLTVAGTGQTSIMGFNRFNTLSNSTTNMSLQFSGGLPTAFTNFNINGSAGNLVSVGSTNSSQATLYKTTAWNVGANSVNGGNNTGLSFTAGSNDYLTISNIKGTNVDPGSPIDYLTNSNVAWIGLQALAKLAKDISTSWIGMQVLTSTYGFSAIPNYMDFGSISNPIPGATFTSSPMTISGLAQVPSVELFSNDGLKFSTDGTNYTDTIQVSNGDQLTLQITLQSVVARYLKIYTTPPSSADVEVGKWYVPGPTGTSKYDQFIYRPSPVGQWADYVVSTQLIDNPISANLNHYVKEISHSIADGLKTTFSSGSDTNAPLGQLQVWDDYNVTDAPTSEFASSLSRSLADVLGYNYFGYITSNESNSMSFVAISSPLVSTDSNLDLFVIQNNNKSIYWDVLKSRSTVWGFEGHYVDILESFTAIISEKVHNILVDKEYTMMSSSDANRYDPVQEVWAAWKPFVAVPEWNKESVARNINIIPVWKYENYLDSTSEALTYWNKLNKDIHISFVQAPTAVINPLGISEVQAYVAEFAKSVTTATMDIGGEYESPHTDFEISLVPEFEWERIYQSTNYVRQGGYATPQLASDAAQVYSAYTTSVYTQPEGTYSYIVEHDMALWCSVVNNQGLRAIAWLLGGG